MISDSPRSYERTTEGGRREKRVEALPCVGRKILEALTKEVIFKLKPEE
jgi:hypothetical protein